MSATSTVETVHLKDKLKATWMAGNYDYFSRFMESSAVEFLDRLPLQSGDRLLDVACGSGPPAAQAAPIRRRRRAIGRRSAAEAGRETPPRSIP